MARATHQGKILPLRRWTSLVFAYNRAVQNAERQPNDPAKKTPTVQRRRES